MVLWEQVSMAPPKLHDLQWGKTAVMLVRAGQWVLVHSCSAHAAPFCPFPLAFKSGSCPEHSCVIAVAQRTAYRVYRGHTQTGTRVYIHTHLHRHMHTYTILPIFSCLLYFPISPSRKMRSLHSWRLLLLTEQMEQSRQLVYHTATVATHSGARSRKNTQALPYGFLHLTLCKDMHICYIYASGMLRNTCIVHNTVVWLNTQNHFDTILLTG